MAMNSMEDFEALLEESFEMDTPEEGSVVKGKVLSLIHISEPTRLV